LARKEIYRPNVAIIILNSEGKALWCRRKNHDGWQFPQGGIDKGETPLDAAYRETKEEVGLDKSDIRILKESTEWIRYQVTEKRRPSYFSKNRGFVGQTQKWFLAELIAEEKNINLNSSRPIEFDKWMWVNYWYPLGASVPFKKSAYRKALTDLMPSYQSFIEE
jgi:putative (di)nucleoside polyphosphate hydrolase